MSILDYMHDNNVEDMSLDNLYKIKYKPIYKDEGIFFPSAIGSNKPNEYFVEIYRGDYRDFFDLFCELESHIYYHYSKKIAEGGFTNMCIGVAREQALIDGIHPIERVGGHIMALHSNENFFDVYNKIRENFFSGYLFTPSIITPDNKYFVEHSASKLLLDCFPFIQFNVDPVYENVNEIITYLDPSYFIFTQLSEIPMPNHLILEEQEELLEEAPKLEPEIKNINGKEIFRLEDCVICLSPNPNLLFCNCGHIPICNDCDELATIKKCPICNTKSTVKRKI